MTAPLRVLIVDDEPLARENLRLMLTAHAGCEICGECGTAARAAAFIASNDPDLVFLDIEMPGIPGLELARSIARPGGPLLIFVTAHANHAVRAFDLGAVDFLLKPFDETRLAQALERAALRTGHADHERLSPRVAALVRQLHGSAGVAARLAVRGVGRIDYIDMRDISRIEAGRNRVSIFANGGSYLTRRSLNSVSRELPPEQFVRIHRSCIVNLAHVQEVRSAMHGDYILRMRDGAQHRLSRRRRDAIARLLPSSRVNQVL